MRNAHTKQRQFGNDERVVHAYGTGAEVFEEDPISTDRQFERDLRFGGDLWEETLRDLRKRSRVTVLSLDQVAGPPS